MNAVNILCQHAVNILSTGPVLSTFPEIGIVNMSTNGIEIVDEKVDGRMYFLSGIPSTLSTCQHSMSYVSIKRHIRECRHTAHTPNVSHYTHITRVTRAHAREVLAVTESAVEAYLRGRVKAMGGMAYKFVSPGNAGVPDRLVLLPEGRVAFVELKAQGKKSTPLQGVQQRRIRNLGFLVYSDVDSKERVDAVIREVMPE